MKKDHLAFFKLYYYWVKKSSKKYEMVNIWNNNFFVVQITPFIFFLLWMLFYVGYGSATGAIWPVFPFMFSGLIFVLNLFFAHWIREEGKRIEREIEEKRREAERMQQAHEQAERMRKHYERMKELEEEMERIRQERIRRQREHFERQWREQQEWRYRQQRTHATQSSTTDRLREAYKTLEIEPTLDSNEIRKAYRNLAKQNHPDVGGNSKRFIAIKNAYDLLMNAVKVSTRKV